MNRAHEKGSSSLKSQVAIAAIKGTHSIAEIARKHKVSENDVMLWQRHLLKGASQAFAPQKNHPIKKPIKHESGKRSGYPNAAGFSARRLHSLTQNVVYWARILEVLYNQKFVAGMRPMRTAISNWRILTLLHKLGPLTVGEIAESTHIDRTVVCRLLDRMTKQGLIARKLRTDDRRVSETRITPKGRKVFHKMKPIREKVYLHATDGIDAKDLEFACYVITKMIDNLGGNELLFRMR